MGTMTFDAWMYAVDRFCEAQSGVSVHDLVDCPFADWYADGTSAASAARKAIRAEMGEDD